MTIETDYAKCDDDERECDSCGVITDAGEWPDWVNGSCESCDPDILNKQTRPRRWTNQPLNYASINPLAAHITTYKPS